MTLPASGEVSMSMINTEFGRTSNTANTSLSDLSDGTVATINTANDSANRPDGSTPHAMSEFYSYDHDAGVSWGSWSAGQWNVDGNQGSADEYLARSITFSGADNTNIDIYFSVNSGITRGNLYVGMSTSSTPSNASATNQVYVGSGNFGASFPINGSGTLYLKFKYDKNNGIDETSNRSIYVRQTGTDSAGLTMVVSTLIP
jgi:hypothetical protein